MGMFEIPADAEVGVFRPDEDPNVSSGSLVEFFGHVGKRHHTRKSQIFGKEDVVFDPAGRLGRGQFRESGLYYGFRIDAPGNSWHGGTIIVSATQLKYNGQWMVEDGPEARYCRRCGFSMCPDGCCCGC